MPQRTIAEAEEAFADLAPQLNPEMYWRLELEVHEAKKLANQQATEYMNQTVTSSTELAQGLLQDSCAVRDSLGQLIADGQAGRIGASDFNKRYQELNGHQRELGRRKERLTGDVERLELIEEDPVAWADDRLHRAMPLLRPQFSF